MQIINARIFIYLKLFLFMEIPVEVETKKIKNPTRMFKFGLPILDPYSAAFSIL